MSVSVLPPSLHLFAAPLDVIGSDLEVPVAPSGWRRFVNLDVAATAPCLTSVWQAVTELVPWYSSVHRGAGFPSQVISERFEAARATVAQFVGAPTGASVVFTSNTTEALNLLAHCVPEWGTVVTFGSEHHASLLAWPESRRVVLAIPQSPAQAVALLDAALATTPNAALVSVTGASNVTGDVWPVAELAAVAHRHGVRVVVDAAQLAPHRAIDMVKLGVDYVALSGHKLYAPFGAGALVGLADWLDDAPPFLRGGGATAAVTLTNAAWRDGPTRHEAGTPNALGVLALAAACRALTAAGLHRIAAREHAIRSRVEPALSAIPGLSILELWPGHDDRVGVLAFTLAGWSGPQLAAALSAEHAIGVRAGRFCAHPLVEHLTRTDGPAPGVAFSDGEPVRISWGAATALEDVHRLIGALGTLAVNGPQCHYEQTARGWAPFPDPRPPAF